MDIPRTARFGELLRHAREAAALSQEALAEKAGLSVEGVSVLERGRRSVPRLDTVALLADALGLAGPERAALLAAARPALLASLPADPRPLTGAGAVVPTAELPTGAVTFLFADVEDSLRRLDAQPQAYGQALVRYHTLMQEAVHGHGGVVVEVVGDAVYAAFARPSAAVAAALAAQRALRTEPWADVDTLRVRMALHTGAVDLHGAHYVGVPLYRGAHLLTAAHGGQVVLTLAAADLSRDDLPEGAGLRDLGEHRLKDLTRPEHVFQLVYPEHPEGPADFPPLRALDVARHNLPVQQTPFIGREREMADVRERLLDPAMRLVTLTGPGGTGKTRLALQVAADVLDEFAQGVYFVSLAPVSAADLVEAAIAQALGLREAGAQPLRETLLGYLRDKEMLLVLDNFEQVAAAAPLVGALLAQAPRLRVIVTSRTVLHLYGEQEYPVPPLALPELHHLPRLDLLTQYEAVALFIARARLAKPGFAVTNESAPAVAEICVRLDGLPLAIELAAAGIKMLPPRALLTRLESRLKALTGGARDLPARHQTLRGTIDWSYDLLDAAEQALFARLSVFVGGCTLEAAEAVCAAALVPSRTLPPAQLDIALLPSCAPDQVDIDGDLPLDVPGGLASLVDKSLVRQDEDVPRGESRFTMLETIREYAAERLAARGETAAVRQAHAARYLALAEEAEPHLTGARQAEWLGRLEVEHDNLRAVLRWAQQSGDNEAGLRLAGLLWRFWWVRGHLSEGRTWLAALLAAAGTPETPDVAAAVRARTLPGAGSVAWALHAAGQLALSQGDYARAWTLLWESLALSRAAEHAAGVSSALTALGTVARAQGDYARARDLAEESLALSRGRGDRAGSATALASLGNLAYWQGDFPRAAALLDESVRLYRASGDSGGVAGVLDILSSVASDRSDYEQSIVLLEESLALRRQLDDTGGIAAALAGLGALHHWRGDLPRATALLEESLALFRAVEDSAGSAATLCVLGLVAHAGGDAAGAQRLLAESLALRRDLQLTWGVAESLIALGAVTAAQGSVERAAALLEEGLALSRGLGHPWGIAAALSSLGRLAQAQGDRPRAMALYAESAALRRDMGDRRGLAECLEGFARLIAAGREPERAARVLGAAAALRRTLGAPLEQRDRDALDQVVAQLRTAMETRAFATAWREGEAMTPEQALEHADVSLDNEAQALEHADVSLHDEAQALEHADVSLHDEAQAP